MRYTGSLLHHLYFNKDFTNYLMLGFNGVVKQMVPKRLTVPNGDLSVLSPQEVEIPVDAPPGSPPNSSEIRSLSAACGVGLPISRVWSFVFRRYRPWCSGA